MEHINPRRLLRAFAVALVVLFASAWNHASAISYTVVNNSPVNWTVRINYVNFNNVTSVLTVTSLAGQTQVFELSGQAENITAVRFFIPANATQRVIAGCHTKSRVNFTVTNCQCPDYHGHTYSVLFDHWNCDNCELDGPPCPNQCGTGTCNNRRCTITQVN